SMIDPRTRMHLNWVLTSRARRERLAELAELTEPFDPHLAVWCRSSGLTASDRTDELLEAASALAAQNRIDEAIELAEKALARSHDLSAHCEPVADLSSQLLRAGELDLSE